MTDHVRTQETLTAFADRFRVRRVRELPSAHQTSRWLVMALDEQGLPEQAGEAESLLELIVLHANPASEVARLGFLELHSDEQASGGALRDVCIDPTLGLALLLSYQPSVALHSTCEQSLLSAAQCATVLLAGLALGVRARSMGYCLGALSVKSVLVDMRGSLRLAEPSGMHAVSEHSNACCAWGVSLDSLVVLASQISGPAGEQLAMSLKQHLSTAAAGEHPLDVALHAFRTQVTPQRLVLSQTLGVDRPSLVRQTGIYVREHSETAHFDASLSASDRHHMPRLASNAPSSRRFFIWVKKRAASAPSTMR